MRVVVMSWSICTVIILVYMIVNIEILKLHCGYMIIPCIINHQDLGHYTFFANVSSKRDTLNQCCFNVDALSATMTNVKPTRLPLKVIE